MGSEDGGARSLGTAYGEGVYFIFRNTTYREGTNLRRKEGWKDAKTDEWHGNEGIRKRDIHLGEGKGKARLVLGGWYRCLRDLDWGYF
jgi:hypothetical protein